MDTSVVPEIARLNITFHLEPRRILRFSLCSTFPDWKQKILQLLLFFFFPPLVFLYSNIKTVHSPSFVVSLTSQPYKSCIIFFFQDFVEFNETHKRKFLDSQNPESWSKPTIPTHSSREQIVLGLTENNLLMLHSKLY